MYGRTVLIDTAFRCTLMALRVDRHWFDPEYYEENEETLVVASPAVRNAVFVLASTTVVGPRPTAENTHGMPQFFVSLHMASPTHHVETMVKFSGHPSVTDSVCTVIPEVFVNDVRLTPQEFSFFEGTFLGMGNVIQSRIPFSLFKDFKLPQVAQMAG